MNENFRPSGGVVQRYRVPEIIFNSAGVVVLQRGRADKKTQVAPFITKWQREVVHDVGTFLRLGSDGEAGCRIVMVGAADVPTINRLSPYFWRTYLRGAVTWPGHNDNENLDELVKPPYEQMERLKMRFTSEQWNTLDELSFALARPVAHTVAVLLTLALKEERIVNKVAPGFVPRSQFTLKRGFYQWGGSIR